MGIAYGTEFLVDVNVPDAECDQRDRHDGEREVYTEGKIKALEKETEGNPQRRGAADQEDQAPVVSHALRFFIEPSQQRVQFFGGVATGTKGEDLQEIIAGFPLYFVDLAV